MVRVRDLRRTVYALLALVVVLAITLPHSHPAFFAHPIHESLGGPHQRSLGSRESNLPPHLEETIERQ